MSGRLWSDHVECGEQHIMETESVDRDGEKGAGIHSLSCEMVLGWEVGAGAGGGTGLCFLAATGGWKVK